MSEEWNSNTLDDILFDMRRMTLEREQADARAQEHPTPFYWSMEDVDSLLGLDDPLKGISDYSAQQDAAPLPDPAPKKPAQPASVTQSAPAPAPQRVSAPAAPEASAPRKKEPDKPAPQETPSGDTKVIPTQAILQQKYTKAVPLHEEDAEEEAPEPFTVEEIPQEETAQAGKEQPTKILPDLSKVSKPKSAAHDGKTKAVGAMRLLRGKKQKTDKPHDPEMVDGQIMLQGFETEPPAQPLDVEQAEQELSERRAEQVKDFKLYDLAQKYDPDLPPKHDIFEPEPEPAAAEDPAEENTQEYRRFGERMQIGRHLQENRRAAFLTVCALLVLEITLIIVSAVAGAKDPDSRSIPYAVNLILTAVATALSISTLSAGALDLVRLAPSCDTAVLITVAASLIHSVIALMLPESEGIPCMFGAAAVLMLLLSKTAKLFECIGILGNFKFCAFTAAEHLHEVRAFADKKDAFEIAQNLDAEKPKLRYAAKTKFPADFLRLSDFHSTVDRLCKFIVPAAAAAALIAALTGWLRTGTGLSALTAFTGTVCIAMPAGAAFTVSVPIVLLMQKLNRRGGMIVSPAAASANTGLTAVALDATDLYDGDQCSIDCYQEFHSIRFDDMFLYAAALVIGAHGPLESAFMEIVGNADILPPVKSLVCEERLGISGYIRGQSVLLGNRNLLIGHSVEAPAKSVEIPYLEQGKRILYLAVGNKVTTMFVVNYIENDALSQPMHILHNNETDLVVYTADCNLSEEFLCEGFDMPKGSIRTMSSKAGEILRERCAEETESAPASLLTGGKAESLLYTLADAAVMHNIQRVASFVGIAACVIGWLVTFILTLVVGEIRVVNWVLVLLYTLLWTAASTTLGVLQMRKAK